MKFEHRWSARRAAWTVGLAAGGLLAAGVALTAAPTTSPPGAAAYFVSLKSGAVVKSPVTIVFGLKGMGIAPAGIQLENTGHHHLLVDTDLPADLTQPLPATDKILHYGKGQTEVTLPLPAGTHTLQLVLGDHLHVPFKPLVASEKITITVQP